jgi:nitrite reductase (NAD(P)H)
MTKPGICTSRVRYPGALLPSEMLNKLSGPLHKRNFKLVDGECLNDEAYSIITFDAKEEDGAISLLLPPVDQLDPVLGRSKWMIRQATAEVHGRAPASQIDIVGPDGKIKTSVNGCASGDSTACGGPLDW